jgi:hypothetical protein
VLPAVGFPHLAPAGYRRVPARDNGGRLQEHAPAVGQPRDAQVITESGGIFARGLFSEPLSQKLTRHFSYFEYSILVATIEDIS